DELVARAAELGHAAIAITDRHNLAGVVRAHAAAREHGLKLIVGAELHPLDAPSLVVLAPDRAAYGRLCRLLTLGARDAPKGECRITFEMLAAHAEGLLAGALLVPLTPPGAHPPDLAAAAEGLGRLRELFGDRAYALAELACGPDDARHLAAQRELARRAGLPPVAANDVQFHSPARRVLHDVLAAVRLGATVDRALGLLAANAERRLLAGAEMAARFAACPGAVARTLEVADRCRFSLSELRYEYPVELCPPGSTPAAHLANLVRLGAAERYPEGVPAKVRDLLERELAIVGELEYEAYFLTVWDLVRFARSRGILCQGRGSAANSAVCYCLGVTSVDPDRVDVLFERFISKERREAPDIDVDFEHERREEVLQYLYGKYGRDRAAMTAEVICYRPRSAVRDVGKALGLSLDRVDRLAKTLSHWGVAEPMDDRLREAGLAPDSEIGRRLAWCVGELVGFPRHLSQHVGGMVLTRDLLCETVPIENAAMDDRTMIQWNKDDLDELGILKVDCLGLGMLTAIRKCFDLVAAHGGPRVELATVPPEDPAVYAMIHAADTVGVFQIESRAQMSMLPRLRPNCFYDLVIEVAIVRPGPIQGKMVHPYLRRRQGLEQVHYPTPELEAVLRKTLGVPLFQEQAMKLAVVAAGFTPGEADQLRRAMAAWRRPGVIETFRIKLLDGMRAKGLPPEFAERVFEQIKGFGEYGFPESHAASFALLVYVSAWLKRHHPAAFCAAILNSQPMGFYAPAQLIADARRHGVAVLPVDVNRSDVDCTLEPEPSARSPRPESSKPEAPARAAPSASPGPCPNRKARSADEVSSTATADRADTVPLAVRLGLRQVYGLPSKAAERLVAARAVGGPFRSAEDLARRAALDRPTMLLLGRADACASLGLDRRAALWRAAAWRRLDVQGDLFADVDAAEPPVSLPPQSPIDAVLGDYSALGLSLKDHPLRFLRPRLDAREVVPAAKLKDRPNGARLSVAGLVLVRQQPGTAKGIRFMTLEDETGVVNLIVRPEVYKRDRYASRAAPVILCEGRLQNVDDVIHVLAERIEDVSGELLEIRLASRDFH
ncbi:MAG TPA: error-prone DNA polymerase, partial [Planctomycetia bacterium]|nr:error-prone DNA polymerase [Planctomycetia bacterium]